MECTEGAEGALVDLKGRGGGVALFLEMVDLLLLCHVLVLVELLSNQGSYVSALLTITRHVLDRTQTVPIQCGD